MKPWNDRSGRIWEGSVSIVAKVSRRVCEARTVSAAGVGIKAMAGARPAKFSRIGLRSAGPVGAGGGVTAQRLDFVRLRGLRDAGKTHFLKLLVDPHGRLVGPANHREPAQDARNSD